MMYSIYPMVYHVFFSVSS